MLVGGFGDGEWKVDLAYGYDCGFAESLLPTNPVNEGWDESHCYGEEGDAGGFFDRGCAACDRSETRVSDVSFLCFGEVDTYAKT